MTGASYGASFPAAGRPDWRSDTRPNYDGGDGAHVFDFTKGFPAALADPGLTTGRTMFDANGKLVYAPENLRLQSEAMGTNPWQVLGDGSVQENQIANPLDGAITGDQFTAGTTSFDGILRQGIVGATVPGVPWANVVYAKKNNHRYLGFRLPNRTGTSLSGLVYSFFDFDTETWTLDPSGGDIDGKTQVFGDGWYRLGFFGVLNGAAIDNVADLALTASDGDTSPAPAGTEKVYLFGSMVYRGDDFIPYMKTEASAYYGPRTKAHYYDGAAWINGGLLFEGQDRTNLALHSRKHDDAVWQASTPPTLAQDEIGADGVANAAWTHTDGDAVGFPRAQQNTVIPSDTLNYCSSGLLKTVTNPAHYPGWRVEAGAVGDMDVDLGSIAVKDRAFDAPDASGIVDYDGWALPWAVNANASSVAGIVAVLPAVNTDFSGNWVASATGSVVADNMQYEPGDFPSMPIITGSAAVLRTKDHSIRWTGAAAEAFLQGLTALTVYVEVYLPEYMASPGTSDNEIVSIHDGTLNEHLRVRFTSTAALTTQCVVRAGGVAHTNLPYTPSTKVGVLRKIAFAAAQDDFELVEGGVTRGTAGTGDAPDFSTMTTVDLCQDRDLNPMGAAYVPKVILYPGRLSRAAMEMMTV